MAHRRPAAVFLLVLAATVGSPGEGRAAEACPPGAAPSPSSARRSPCPPAEPVRPYEPDRVRAGREPGFIDLGNGTEVRIGGRVRLDVDTRR